MIKKELLEDGSTKIYSDSGKKIIQKETGCLYSVAIETLNGVHYKYTEADE